MADRPVLPVPPDWNVSRDLVVLVGRGHDAEAGAWIAGGQERLVVLLPEGAQPFAAPEPCVVTDNRLGLLQAVMDFPGQPPEHVTFRTSADPWATRERVERLGKYIEECVHSKRIALATICRNGPEVLDRAFSNVAHVIRHASIAALDGAFEGKPCVLVSPGPSLSKNLHLLKELKGDALLVTGTHALASFRSAGVAPDILLASDSGELDAHFDGYDIGDVGAFAVCISARNENFERGARRTFTFAGNPGTDDWIYEPLAEDARLPTGGSVACSAFSLAVRMGCDPIVFVGQDLSFSGGRYYAEENIDGDARIELEDDGRFFLRKPTDTTADSRAAATEDDPHRFTKSKVRIELPGYDGGVVPSSESFRAFLFWFEANVETLAGSRRVWNCTEGGARIAGTDQMPLEQAHAAIKAQDQTSRLEPGDVERALSSGYSTADDSFRATRLREHLEALSNHLATCHDLALRARRAHNDASSSAAALARFEKLERELSASIKNVGPTISLVAQAEIIAALDEGRRSTNLEENLAAAGKLVRVVQRAVERVRTPTRRALTTLARTAS